MARTYVVSLDDAAATERARWGTLRTQIEHVSIPDEIQNAIKRALNANASGSDCTGDGSVLALAARDRVVS